MQLKVVRIFFFGDSICFGQDVSPHRTWVTRISEALSETFRAEAEIVVQNPSINGNTTRMALERIAYDVQAHRPDVLIVQFGMNDCNVWGTDKGRPRVSPEAFAANLGEIIDRARACGASQIVIGANHSTTRSITKLPNVSHSYEVANRQYNTIVREVANKKRARLADLERAFDRSVSAGEHQLADLLLPDELHLSERGHDIYFAHYLPIVESAVAAVLKERSAPIPNRSFKAIPRTAAD